MAKGIQFYRDSDACYYLNGQENPFLILEGRHEVPREITLHLEDEDKDLNVIPYVVGSGSHNGFRLKIGDAEIKDTNLYASIAFHLPTGDRTVIDDVSHRQKYNKDNQEYDELKHVAAGLVYYMSDELLDYSKNQNIQNAEALDAKLAEFSSLPPDQQEHAMEMGMQGISREQDLKSQEEANKIKKKSKFDKKLDQMLKGK